MFKFINREGVISFFLGLSASSMISISLFDLIPSAFGIISSRYNAFVAFVGVLLSIFIVYFILYIFKKKSPLLKNNDLAGVGALSALSIIIHNFPEGIASFFTSYNSIKSGIRLSFAIMMHNIPEGIFVAFPTYLSSGSKKRGVIYSLICGIFEPLGALMGYILLRKYMSRCILGALLIIAASVMIVTSIEEIIPSINIYNNKRNSIIGAIVGLIISLLSLILL